MPGLHCISVLFGDNEIPISPIKVNVEPSIDINKIRIEGLDTSKLSFANQCYLDLSKKNIRKILFFYICLYQSINSFFFPTSIHYFSRTS
jgi:hypothetical protein